MQQILVVDDEIGIRELLSEILSDEGYQVRLAENAGEARAYRSQARPDLVLLDIWMPDTDGITLLKEWASAGLLTMPVVMMSGHGTIDTAVEATRIGAYDFLEKPIALQKLLATVGRALKHGGEQRAAGALARELGRAPLVAELKQRLERVAEPARAAAAHRRAGLRPRARGALPAPAQHAVGRAGEPAALAEAPLELLNQAREGTLFLQRGGGALAGRAEGAAARSPPSSSATTCAWSAAPRATLAELVAQGAFDSRLYARSSRRPAIRVPSLREHREDVPDIANLMLSRMVEAKEVAAARSSRPRR